MIELGKLESQWQEFEKRNVKVLAVSVEGQENSKAIQDDFPHLAVVADADRKLANAALVVHPGSAPDGGDTAAPTTFLIDGKGVVRWTHRPGYVMSRLTPAEVLAAIDKEMPEK